MNEIFLDEWAKKNRVSRRTAQSWASLKKIPAEIKKKKVVITRSIRKYVIDKNAPVPR